MDSRLPELPESSWNGDNKFDWLGAPFEFTRTQMRIYGMQCYEAGKRATTQPEDAE